MKIKFMAIGALIMTLVSPYAALAVENTPQIPRLSDAETTQNSPDYKIENISTQITMKKNIVESIDEVNNVKVKGQLPRIININNAEFAGRINKKIENSYLNLVNAGYEKISVDFDLYNWGNITSIVVKYSIGQTAGSPSKEVVKTFVFDAISQQEVTLRNLLGKDYAAFVNSQIKAEIAESDPGVYFKNPNGFSSIRPNQSFYISEGKLMIVFDENSIGPSSTGTPVFEIFFDNTISYNLGSNEYAVFEGKNYIPLSVIFRLGMNINLKEGGVMEIISQNGGILASVNVNNENVSHDEIILIDGYNIGINENFAKLFLGIETLSAENSKELEIRYLMP